MAEKIYNIGVEATMDVIGGKWKPIILCNLRHGALRPSDLRQLEESDIVTRKSYNQVPPTVEYSLSEYGETLGGLLDTLCQWGTMHVAALQGKGEQVTLLEQEEAMV